MASKIVKMSNGKQMREKPVPNANKAGMPKGVSVKEIAARFGKEAEAKRPDSFDFRR